MSDLEKVTKQAYAMVSIYGLNERIGNISFYDPQGNSSFVKPYSDETAKAIDEEASKIIENQYQRALKILSENRDKLEALAEKLLKHEVIFKEDLVEIFGTRPWDKDEESRVETTNPLSDLSVEDSTAKADNNEVAEQTEGENPEQKDETGSDDELGERLPH